MLEKVSVVGVEPTFPYDGELSDRLLSVPNAYNRFATRSKLVSGSDSIPNWLAVRASPNPHSHELIPDRN